MISATPNFAVAGTRFNFTNNLFPIHSRQRADGMACDLVLSAQGAVSALCIDQVNGCIVAGVQEIIRWEKTPYSRGL